MKIVFFLSSNDFLIGAVVEPCIVMTLIYNSSQYSCSLHLTAEFLLFFFTHLSGYLICVISFDRYAMLKYLNLYSEVVTKRRIRLTVLAVTLLSVINATITALASYKDEKDTYGRLSNTYTVLVFLTMVCIQLLTLRAANNYRKSVTFRLSDTDLKLVRLAQTMVCCLIFFYIPFLFVYLMDSLNNGEASAWHYFVFYTAAGFSLWNSTANALLVFKFNNVAFAWIQNCLRRNRVTVRE